MALYWCFQLGPVAHRILYLDEIKKTQSYWELLDVIDASRRQFASIRTRSVIPDASLDRRTSR